MKVKSQQIIDALKDEFAVCSYSGRAMYGKNCVGVDVDKLGDVMKIAAVLMHSGMDVDEVFFMGGAMKVDNMGLGYIVYWPAFELSAEEHEALQRDEEEEEV